MEKGSCEWPRGLSLFNGSTRVLYGVSGSCKGSTEFVGARKGSRRGSARRGVGSRVQGLSVPLLDLSPFNLNRYNPTMRFL